MKQWTKRSLAALLTVLMAVSCAAFGMTAFAVGWCPMCDGDLTALYGDPPATTKSDGEMLYECPNCGYRLHEDEIYRIDYVGFHQNTYAYTGTPRKPAPIVADSHEDLIGDDNYEVTYKNNTAIGKATAIIEFNGCYYEGKVTRTFIIAPAKMAAPTVVNAPKGFKISWTKQPKGAGGYQIWRKKGTGKYQKIATIKDPSKRSYADSSDAANENGTKYAYKIRAYKTVKGVDYLGLISAEKVSYKVARPAAPAVKNSGAGKISVSWKKNAKASGYKVKYVTGKTTKIAEVKGASITGVSLSVKRKAKYSVYVQAYKTVSGKTYHSCFSPAKTITTT